MISKRLILSANVAMWLICAITGDVHAWASMGTGWDTHKDITKDVLNNLLKDDFLFLERDYPDLVMFGEQLRDGSNKESHNLPDGNNTEWWMPDNLALWFTAGRIMESSPSPHPEYGALWAYTNYVFNGAYLRIGYELHLLQDESVPAHQNYCFHGDPVYKLDSLEVVAGGYHFYAKTETPWSYNYTHHDGTSTFQYWLSDDMDDDDRDDEACFDDEWDLEWFPIEDGPAAYGVPNTDWGTYGQPELKYVDYHWELSEELPGRNEGIDYFASAPKLSIIKEQLQAAYDATLERMKERSKALPPLVPDDDVNGKPSISLKIFGPNKPVEISFVAMENRQPKVFVSVLAGSAGGIWDTRHGKFWDGTATTILNSSSSPLPWKDTIISCWNGDTGTGQVADGNHVVSMQIRDQDGHSSEKRTRSVKFDKTPPDGTITFRNYSADSYP